MVALFQDKYVFSRLIAFLNRIQFNNYVTSMMVTDM